MSQPDTLLRFIFDTTDIRGEWVQLEQSYQQTLANHHYPPAVRRLIGQFLAAASLLGATLKFEGSIVLQARSDGEVPLVMAEATSDRCLRAIVRGAETALSDDFTQLIGAGTLTLTIDPVDGQRYQGIVVLDGGSLAACIESYFLQSEQLPTRIWLAADERRAAGLFLQELPSHTDAARRAEQWQHLLALANTLTDAELLDLPGDTLLRRLFHQEPLRLLGCDTWRFQCSCSRDRAEAMLVGLGGDELRQILAEQGEISVNCEFCNETYRFSKADVETLLGAEQTRH
jgi:molecular chaperone Hsp33